MKRLFYLLFGLVLLPALLYAQGSLSPKDINDNLTNNYYTKTVSDSKYGTTASVALKADKTYVDANFATTAENALKQNIADMVDYYTKTAADLLLADKADTDSVYTKTAADILLGLKADLTYVNATDEAILLDDDSQDVTIEANKVGVASLEVGLQTHQNKATGAHTATAISTTSWDNVQTCLDSLEAAIQSIVVGSGFALESWVNSTLETNFYNKAQTNATIEAAIAAIPAPSVNQTVTVTAGEALTAGQVVSLINESGTMKAYNIPLTASTSPNGAESVFNSAATTYCSAVALDSTRFLVAYVENSTPRAIIGTVSGSSITWGSEREIISTVNCNSLSTCLINTDKVLLTYNDTTVGNKKAFVVVLSVSTSTITENTSVQLAEGTGGVSVINLGLTRLENDKAVALFSLYDGSWDGQATVITVSATTPTVNTPATYNTGGTNYISVSALSSTSAIVAYQDGGNSNYGTAQVLSISGTTITPGTEYVFSGTSAATHIACVASEATSANIVYRITNTGAYITKATNLSGTMAFNELTLFSSGSENMFYPSIVQVGTNKSLVAFFISATGNKSYLVDTSGTTPTLTKESLIDSTSSSSKYYNTLCYLGSQKSVIAYSDGDNSSYGTAVVNTWATSSYASVSGISSGAYSSGSDAVVLISGVSDDQSGLITGSPYFLQSNFTIGTTPVSLTSSVYSNSATAREIKIGTAKSATELIIGIDYK